MNDPQTEINGIIDCSYTLPFVGNVERLSIKAVGMLIDSAVKEINNSLHICDYSYFTITRKKDGFWLNFIFDVPCFIDNRFEALESAHIEAREAVDNYMDDLINILETE